MAGYFLGMLMKVDKLECMWGFITTFLTLEFITLENEEKWKNGSKFIKFNLFPKITNLGISNRNIFLVIINTKGEPQKK